MRILLIMIALICLATMAIHFTSEPRYKMPVPAVPQKAAPDAVETIDKQAIHKFQAVDWSRQKPATAYFYSDEKPDPKRLKSKLVRIATDKPEYNQGEAMHLLIRIDEPAGANYSKPILELARTNKFYANDTFMSDPTILPETPNSLYYEGRIEKFSNRENNTGIFDLRVIRFFLERPREPGKPRGEILRENYQIPIKIKQGPKE